MTRSFGSLCWVALLFAAAPALVGCDFKALLPPPPAPAPTPVVTPGPPPETNNAIIMAHRAGKNMELTLQMQQLATLALMSSLNSQPFAKDWDALIASDPNNKAFYEELREAGVVVVWNAADYERQVGSANTIVAYGPWALEQGGPVATIDGRATANMPAEDLKAKLAAMGVEPVAPAPPAETPAAAPAETPAP